MADEMEFNVNVNANTTELRRVAEALENLSRRIDALGRKSATAKVNVDTKKAERDLDAFSSRLKSQMAAAVQALPRLELGAGTTDFERKIAQVRAKMAQIGDAAVDFKGNPQQLILQIERVQARLQQLAAQSPNIKFTTDIAAAQAALTAFDRQAAKDRKLTLDTTQTAREVGALAQLIDRELGRAIKSLPELDVTATTTNAQADLQLVRRELASLSGKTVGVDIASDDALRRIDLLRGALESLTRSKDIQVSADAGAALAALNSIDKEVNKRREVKIDVKAPNGGAFADRIKNDLAKAVTALPEIKPKINLSDAERSIRFLRTQMEYLNKLTVGVDIDSATAMGEIEKIRNDLRALQGDADLQIAADATTALRALDDIDREVNKTREIKIDARQAKAELGSFARDFQTTMTKATSQIAKIDVNLATAPAYRDMERIRSALGGLSGRQIGIDISAEDAVREVAELRAELESISNSQSVDINVRTDAQAAIAELGRLQDQIQRVNDSRIVIRDPGISKVMANVVSSTFNAINSLARFSRNLSTLAVPATLSTGIGTISNLGATLATAAQSAMLLPAALTAGATAVGTVGIGFRWFGDVMKEVSKRGLEAAATHKDVVAALAKMAPAAQAVWKELFTIGKAWNSLALGTQQAMWDGISSRIRELAGNYLPLLRQAFTTVATSINGMMRDTADFFNGLAVKNDMATQFGNITQAVEILRRSMIPLLSIWNNLATVGSEFLPHLAAQFTTAAQKVAAFVQTARETGQLRMWMAQGIQTLESMGRTAINVGAILAGVFRASRASGADLLGTFERLSLAVRTFVNSGEGQMALIHLFQSLRESTNALIPGLQSLAVNIGQGLSSAHPAVVALAQAFSQILTSLAPVIPAIANLAGTVIPLFAGALGGLMSILGPIPSTVLAIVAAWRLFGGIGTAVIAPVANSIGNMAARMQAMAAASTLASGQASGFATATSRVAAAGAGVQRFLDGAARSLPLVGVALLAASELWDHFGSKADENSQKVLANSMKLSEAIRQEADVIQSRNLVMQQMEGEGAAVGQGIAELTGQIHSSSQAMDTNAQAAKNVNDAFEAQISKLPPLQEAQARVTLAQEKYNLAVEQFTANSPQARDAQAQLAMATDRLEQEQNQAALATKTHTDRMIEQIDAAAGAANADLGYQQSLLRLEEAQNRAAEAARVHKEGSLELRQANLDLVQANIATADAARRLATAEAEANGVTNAAEIGALRYKDELLRLAAAASGPTRDALLKAAEATRTTGAAATTTEAQTLNLKAEMGRLGAMASGPMATALQQGRQRVEEIGNSNISAEEKARRQKDELLRLANMAAGPLRTELTNMANQIRTLPDGDFTISGTGKMNIDNTLRLGATVKQNERAAGGVLPDRFADGGTLPGYTPGRDVHNFVSPTGGRLLLSGGEAVMRPEWTRAVTPGWVNAANKAARDGGIQGIQQFLTINPPGRTEADQGFASGGIIGSSQPVQRLAMGGFIRPGVPWTDIPPRIYNDLVARMKKEMADKLVAEVKKREAAAASALGGGTVAGNVGAMMAALRGRFPGLALISGFRPGAITATGNRSYHGMGRAVDIPPRMDVFNWIKATYGARTKELIFSPAGGNQVWNGRNHMYTGITRAMHFDHVHWAMRNGGIIPRTYDSGGYLGPGATLATNRTGRPERVLNPSNTAAFDQLVRAISPGQRSPIVGQGMSPQMAGEIRSALREGLIEAVKHARKIENHNTFNGIKDPAQGADKFARRFRANAAMGTLDA